MITGNRVRCQLHWDLDPTRPPNPPLPPLTPTFLSDGYIQVVSQDNEKLRVEFNHSKTNTPFVVFGDYTTNDWSIDLLVQVPRARVQFGEWWEPLWKFDVNLKRGTAQFTIDSKSKQTAECCGVWSSAPCRGNCPRKRMAKRIRKMATENSGRRFGLSKDVARQWAWSDNDAFRNAVLDSEKYIRSKRGLCPHSVPLGECTCTKLNANLRTTIQKSLGTTVKMKVVLPATHVPAHMRCFVTALTPSTWTSRSGKKMYGVKGGEWGRGETKLERRRIRSRAKVVARQWPTLPTHFQSATIELLVMIDSLTMSMQPAVGPDYKVKVDGFIINPETGNEAQRTYRA